MLEFYNSKYVTARKDHKCDLCGGLINKGQKYLRKAGKYDGEFFDDKLHTTCQNIIEAFCIETGENEYCEDYIQEWLYDKYCVDCKHHEYNDGDCEEVNLCICPNIRKHYKEK